MNKWMVLPMLAAFWFISNFLPAKALAMTATFDQKISSQGNLIVTLKVSVKDQKVRSESSVGTITNILIRNEKGAFNYFPSQKTAIKLPAVMQEHDPLSNLGDFSAFLKKKNAQVVGSETVDGHSCDIYRFMDPSNQIETKTWVWKEKQFPVKMEILLPNRPTTIEFSNIEFGAKIEDSVFELPADVAIKDFSEVVKPPVGPPPGGAATPRAPVPPPAAVTPEKKVE